ncbi:MAG: Fic family protein [Pseudolabrys sp.]|nr:Fic family protein [Pseudolabrys sp.]MDP2294492.1 Fic family protein [Pseudolabrys sp.]
MTFDPFGDFETQGYLRNHENEKDLDIVRRLEHASFATGLDEAFARLAKVERLQYEQVLDTHRVLFDAIYPWAGQDRMKTAPDIAVSKGVVLFAHPNDIRPAIDYALKHGQDKTFMASKPGEVMGYLAHGHPFLDGNGRTIMVVHSVLAQRAGFSIDWAKTDKTDYLLALTQELDAPGKGILDRYLKPFMGEAIAYEKLGDAVMQAPGLDGKSDDANTVLGKTTEPNVKTRYEEQKIKRGGV